jgi:molybdopterin-containing oxidoreductase family iron-sulfur binding subunit
MEKRSRKSIDLNSVRERLSRSSGRQYWRSFEELAETDEFKQMLEEEFPQQARTWGLDLDRRKFLTLLGASLGLAGLSGCRYLPEKRIVPFIKQPEDMIPGVALYFASAMPLGGYGYGILVESHEGRPTKIEGNPDHPATIGASNVFMQAATLTMYDPDRSKTVTFIGQETTWDAFVSAMRSEMQRHNKSGGAGLYLLTEPITSPTLAGQIAELLKRYPQARWHVYDPVSRDAVAQGARIAFGEALNPIYHFDRASVVLSLDSDFFVHMPGSIRYARDFMDRRRVRDERDAMNRLYSVETTPTVTGAVADHNMPLRQAELESFARAVAHRLGVDVGAAAPTPPASIAHWIDPLVSDLKANRGRSIVIASDQSTPELQALCHAMNAALENIGVTVTLTDPVEATPDGFTNGADSLRALVADMQADKVRTLLILGGNPVYDAPADIPFEAALRRCSERGRAPADLQTFTAHLSLYNDETSMLSQWHVPEAHFLESWGDVRAYDGTASIIQPLILPIYDGKSKIEVLSALLLNPDALMSPSPGYDTVRAYWSANNPGADWNKLWQRMLNDGVIHGTAASARAATIRAGAVASFPPAPAPGEAIDIVFRPDPTVWDGRFANNGWLQELPKPISKLCWDNAVYMSPNTAKRLGVGSEDLVELTMGAGEARAVNGAVWVLPGIPDGSITLHLGYGRTNAGQVGSNIGFKFEKLRTSSGMWSASGVAVRKSGYYGLCCTEHHYSIDVRGEQRIDPAPNSKLIDTAQGRDLIHVGDISEYRKRKEENASKRAGTRHIFWPEDAQEPTSQPSMWDDAKTHELKYVTENGTPAYAWGMSIDMSVCIGCNACVVACEAENNTPVIGKTEVERGREMAWLRIDRYWEGDSLENPNTYFMPVMCVHCEEAPCEPVCPVAATVHSREGLNQQVYNRCVGTRYCSNNCPYKVRRFNFLNYANDFSVPVKLMANNPNVTVRGRGVMEKCSYCVQRINAARIEAKKEDRAIRDGEVVTACQQACPTEAIVFGDINVPTTKVARLKAQEQAYQLLAEQNTRPRTSHLAKITNKNPEIKA